MNKLEEKILEEYSIGYSAEVISYEVMGRMLDNRYTKERLQLFDIRSMYIYGGTYMAVQLYRIGKQYVDVRGIVDKYGKIIGNHRIPVMMLDELKEKYAGEKIVVTPIRFFQEIKSEIEQFVNKEDIIGIGELFLGMR